MFGALSSSEADQDSTFASMGKTLDTPDEKQGTLQELSDPALISLWSLTRMKVALGDTASKPRYDAVRTEYERRIGRTS